MADSSDTGNAAAEFGRMWAQLEPLISEARALEAQANANPVQWDDPWVQAHTRWLSVFGEEIDAVRKVRNGLAHGVNLSDEDIRSAARVGQKLLDILLQGRQRVRLPVGAGGATATA
jgi:hypothetical protein